DAFGVEPGGMRHRMAGDVDHRARGGGMHRGAQKAFGLADALALQHFLADLDHAGGRGARTLAQRHDQPRRERRALDGGAGGFVLVGVGLDAAVELEQSPDHAAFLISTTGYFHFQVCTFSATGVMLMQSTGQGAMHSSHPVHSGDTTVCICLAAPTMASTGQAWIHSVQPMQVCSSMIATDLGFSTPCSSESGLNSRPSRSASLRMPSSPPGGHWLISASPLAMASA